MVYLSALFKKIFSAFIQVSCVKLILEPFVVRFPIIDLNFASGLRSYVTVFGTTLGTEEIQTLISMAIVFNSINFTLEFNMILEVRRSAKITNCRIEQKLVNCEGGVPRCIILHYSQFSRTAFEVAFRNGSS